MRNMSAQPLDARMAHLEGAYDQISHRLNGIDQRLDGVDRRIEGVERKIDTLREHMDRRFENLERRLDQKFLWVIGLVLVSMILPVVERAVPH